MKTEGRLTQYRKIVLETLRGTTNHPTAAEVFRMVRKRRPGVAYATIYNSLNWLQQQGMIGRIDFAEEAARFDPIVERHDHLICRRCGALRDASLMLPARVVGRAARARGFRVEYYRIQLYGQCKVCARRSSSR
jgi:Fur family transcriptional regulator, peroxide stress response regulator